MLELVLAEIALKKRGPFVVYNYELSEIRTEKCSFSYEDVSNMLATLLLYLKYSEMAALKATNKTRVSSWDPVDLAHQFMNADSMSCRGRNLSK